MTAHRDANSGHITTDKTWPKPQGACNQRKFHIYRWNRDDSFDLKKIAPGTQVY